MGDRLRPVIEAVESRCRAGQRTVLAMDGMSAAGKTTAAALSALWDAPVVHMDDFFLPAALRTPQRLSEPGGNVHYERFAAEVLPALTAGKAFSYRPFLCSAMEYGPERHIPAGPVIIVEGAYAMHPKLGSYADVTVFFSVAPDEQARRVKARAPEKWDAFRTRWIPMATAYHRAFAIRDAADIVI